jgi:Tfp pilus assembly PilM family ATPase
MAAAAMRTRALLERLARPVMHRWSWRRARSVLAIDIEARVVRAVHVRREASGLVLDGYRKVKFREGTDLARAFGRALELRQNGEPVALSLTRPEAAIRKIELPPLTPDELLEALPWEAKRHFASLPDDAILDAQILRSPEGGPLEVLLVAFPRAIYQEVEAIWSSAQAVPEFVDLGQLAVLNAYRLAPGRSSQAPSALLDLGEESGALTVLAGEELLLFRDLSGRSRRLDTLLAETFGLGPPELEALKEAGKLPNGTPPERPSLEEALGDLLAELAEDLRSSLVFVENRTGHSLERIDWVGSAAAFLGRHGLLEAVAASAGVPLERWNPLQGFRFGLIDEVGLRGGLAEYGPSAGLARRFFAAA